MPDPVHVTRAADIKTSDGQTEGMIRQGAIVDKSDKVCASGMPSQSRGEALTSSRMVQL